MKVFPEYSFFRVFFFRKLLLGAGNESKLSLKSLSYKEKVYHMKEHIGVSSPSKFQNVWMKSNESSSFTKLRKSGPYKLLYYEKGKSVWVLEGPYSASFQPISFKLGRITTFEVSDDGHNFNQSIDFNNSLPGPFSFLK